jgi:hypothetical protein
MRAGATAVIAGVAAASLDMGSPAYGATTTPQVFQAQNVNTLPVTVQGASGQSADLTQWQDANGSVLAKVDLQGRVLTNHITIDDSQRGQAVAPELHYIGANGKWLSGIDVGGVIPARDFAVASKWDYPNPGNVDDLIYAFHNGAGNPPTVGIGTTAVVNSLAFRLHVSPEFATPSMGALHIEQSTANRALAILVEDFGHTAKFSVGIDGSVLAYSSLTAPVLRGNVVMPQVGGKRVTVTGNNGGGADNGMLEVYNRASVSGAQPLGSFTDPGWGGLYVDQNVLIGPADAAGGAHVAAFSNASPVPSLTPHGGGVLYADAGALKWKGSNGTITTLASA